ncbi:MAG: type II secretion system protein [Gammaproteobacteria bacterium]|nr:type II secretion system protein [Gammaproteobacteria bacterium]
MAKKLRQRGFTLLEVLVATTIVGLVFGGVFSAIVVARDLGFRTQRAFSRDTKLRYLANTAILYARYGDKAPKQLLPENSRVDDEEIALEFSEETVIQTGKLERLHLEAENVEPVSAIIWVKYRYIK